MLASKKQNTLTNLGAHSTQLSLWGRKETQEQNSSHCLQKIVLVVPNVTLFHMRSLTVSSIILPFSLKTPTQERLYIII